MLFRAVFPDEYRARAKKNGHKESRAENCNYTKSRILGKPFYAEVVAVVQDVLFRG